MVSGTISDPCSEIYLAMGTLRAFDTHLVSIPQFPKKTTKQGVNENIYIHFAFEQLGGIY